MTRLNFALPRALDANADPSSGGLLYVYEAGTSTSVTTYADEALTTPHPVPVVADASGLFPAVFVPEGSYKITVKTSAGVTLQEADELNIVDSVVGVQSSLDSLDAGVAANQTDITALDSRVAGAETDITTLESSLTYAAILKSTWSALEATTGAGDGQRAEVPDTDTGTHLAASATGYDGASVANAGQYSWSAAWSRWVRIGGTGLAGKADPLATQSIGNVSGLVTGTKAPNTVYVFADTVTETSYVKKVYCYAAETGTLRVAAYSTSGSVHTREQEVAVPVTAGLNEITLSELLRVRAGERVGFYGPYTYVSGAGPSGGFYGGGFPEKTFTDGSVANSLNFQVGVDLEEVRGLDTLLVSDQFFGDGGARKMAVIGRRETPVTGSALSATTRMFVSPMFTTGVIYRVRLYATTPGSVSFRAFANDGTDFVQQREVTMDFAIGLNELEPNLEVRAGETVGFYPISGSISYTGGTSNPDSDKWIQEAGNVTSIPVGATTSTIRLEIGFDFATADDFERRLLPSVEAEAAAETDVVGYILVWVIGQSNGVGLAPSNSAEVFETGDSYKYVRSSTSLATLADPTGNQASVGGSALPAMARQILNSTGGKIGIIVVNSAEGGTSLTTSWASGGASWVQAQADLSNALTDALANSLNIVGGCVYFNQGESDNGKTKAVYKAAFLDLLSRIDTEVGVTDFPIIMAQTGRASSADGEATVRQAQAELTRENGHVYMAHAGAKYYVARSLMNDEFHYLLQGYEEQGRTVAEAVLAHGMGMRVSGLD